MLKVIPSAWGKRLPYLIYLRLGSKDAGLPSLKSTRCVALFMNLCREVDIWMFGYWDVAAVHWEIGLTSGYFLWIFWKFNGKIDLLLVCYHW